MCECILSHFSVHSLKFEGRSVDRLAINGAASKPKINTCHKVAKNTFTNGCTDNLIAK